MAMYTFNKAVGLKDRDWSLIDIEKISLKEVMRMYDSVRVTLTHVALSGPVELNLSDVNGLVVAESRNIIQWLEKYGATALPVTAELTDIDTKYLITYKDCFDYGFNIEPTDAFKHIETRLPRASQQDILLTHPRVEPNRFYNNCLFMVNGFIHPSYPNVLGTYVLDADKNCRAIDNNEIGFIDFSAVGTIERLSITPEMFYTPLNNGEPLSEAVHINLGKSVAGKTVLLVLAGTLHILDATYRIVGDGLVKLELTTNDWLNVFANCKDNLDTSSYTKDIYIDGNLNINEFVSDRTLKALLQDKHTFFVVLDNTELCLNRLPLGHTGIIGKYDTTSKVQGLLYTDAATHGNYLTVEEDGVFVVGTSVKNRINYKYKTTDFFNTKYIDFKCCSVDPVELINTHILNAYTLNGGVRMLDEDLKLAALVASTKENTSNYAPLGHRHGIPEIDGLADTLQSLAPLNHKHEISEIHTLEAEIALINERLKLVDGGSF